MSTVVATDVSIHVYNGRYYYASQVETIIKRYYAHFGKLKICSRVLYDTELPTSLLDVTDMIEGIVVIPSLEKTMLGLYDKKIRKAVQKSDFIICRCPGLIAHRAADFARKYKKPYLAESMGCAWDAYWNHGFAGKVIAPYVFFKMKQTVYHADYALYVTNRFLQERYPCKNESIAASNVLIKTVDEAVLQQRLDKFRNIDGKTVTLMTTAAVDVRYKGQEFVIKAIPALNKVGIRVRYVLIGGGDQSYLKEVARICGVEGQVEFAGRQSLEQVFKLLDEADIYIQPSLQEGLPRSVIEAMSRGCPVIGAKTAGIPELISPECIVNRKSPQDIAQTVQKILEARILMQLAEENFAHSQEYLAEKLDLRRNTFFDKIKQTIDKMH